MTHNARHTASPEDSPLPVWQGRQRMRLHGLLITILAVAVLMAATGCATRSRPDIYSTGRVVPGTHNMDAASPQGSDRDEETVMTVGNAPAPLPADESGPLRMQVMETNATAPDGTGPEAVVNATAQESRFTDTVTGQRVPLSPEMMAKVRTAKIKELRKPGSMTATEVTKNGRRFMVPLSPSQIKGRRTFGGYTESIIRPNSDFGRKPERETYYKTSDNMGILPFQAAFFTVKCNNGEMGHDIFFHNYVGTDRWCMEGPLAIGSKCFDTKDEILAEACAKVEGVLAQTPPQTGRAPAPEGAARNSGKAPTPPENVAAHSKNSARTPAAQQSAVEPTASSAAPDTASAAPAQTATDSGAEAAENNADNSGFFGFMKALVGM